MLRIFYTAQNITESDFTEIYINPEKILTEDYVRTKYENVYEEDVSEVILNIGDYLEKIFQKFNSNKNPLINNLSIREKVKHTSMSVGDVIELNNIMYVVCICGFVEISTQ